MKIKQVESRINASYNTIRKFIGANKDYYYKVENVIHVTDLGISKLEERYGLKSEILADDNINFYKNQIVFLKQQLEENKQYNSLFINQIETKDSEVQQMKDKLNDIQEKIRIIELEKIQLSHELSMEKNKSIWKKIFNRGE